MKPFLIKTFIYLCLIALVFSYPVYILISSKENLYNINNINTGDENQKYLVGYAYNEDNYGYLKYSHIINNPKYTVMALGSSRVLQFRAQMFEAPFYNAGYTIETIGEFEQFLKLIPDEKLPAYLIIGLDQWMFNENTSKAKKPDAIKWTDNNSTSYKNTLKDIKAIIKDIWDGKIHYFHNFEDDSLLKIGLNAIINNKGFRNDGSMYYGDQINKLAIGDSTAIDYLFSNTKQRISQGNKRFEYGNKYSKEAIVILDHLLHLCKEKRIEVIAFIPPYADEVFWTMQKQKKYKYIERDSLRSYLRFSTNTNSNIIHTI